MNTSKSRWYRSLAVMILAAAGILTTIATGGGGGSGGGGPITSGPTLAITADNGQAVSASVVTGVVAMFQITEATGDPLLEPVAGSIPVLQKIGEMPDAYSEVPVEGTEPCAVSGSISISGELADPTTLTEGDTITAVFDNCDDNEGFVIDGELGLTIAAIDGDPFSSVFLISLDMTLTDLIVSADGESITSNGDLTYTLDTLEFPVVVTELSGIELTVAAAGDEVTFRNFDQVFEADTGVVPETIAAEASGRLRSSVLGGSVDYETIVTIQASGDNDPDTGEILITGLDDSQVRIVIVSDTEIRLEIDVDGDGVVDEFIDTNWSALDGTTS